MSRYAYGGRTTVESCQSIDVLHWNRLGYFRYSPWFSWVRTRDGERLASVEIRHRLNESFATQSGVKRTSKFKSVTSAFDPQRSSR